MNSTDKTAISSSLNTKFFTILFSALVFETIGGLYLYMDNSHSVFNQVSLLFHIFAGLLLSIPFTIYMYKHFISTLLTTNNWSKFVGYSGFIIISIVNLTGLYQTFVGFEKGDYWISYIHTWMGFLGVLVIPLHIIVIRIGRWAWKNENPGSSDAPVYGYIPMKVVITCIITSTVLFSAQGIFSMTYKDIEYRTKRPENYSMALGENPFAPSEATTVTGDIIDAKLVGNSRSCAAKSCHTDIYRQWYSSAHRYSSTDVFYRKAEQYMIDTAGKEASRYCAGCHDPVALISGGLTPGAGFDSEYSDEGSSCILCHAISKVRHLKGSGSFKVDIPERYLFANRDGAFYEWVNNLLIKTSPEKHKSEFSRALFMEPEYCAVCHKQYIKDPNNWGWVKLQDQYGEWLSSHYSSRNDKGFYRDDKRVCIDCHMPLVDSNDPSAGKDKKIRSHRFIAANTAVPWLDGDFEQFALTKKWLKSRKILIDIFEPRDKNPSRNIAFIDNEVYQLSEPSPYVTMGEEVELNILLTNSGVGHGFPNGPLDIYEAWLEVKVTDAQDNVIFWSGNIDEKGYVEKENTRFFYTLGVDRRGKLIDKHNLWHMIGNTYKKIIKPGHTDLSTHKFVVPYWVKGDITVIARLRYRRFNRWFTEWVFEDTGKDVRLPIVDMARDTISIPVRMRPDQEINLSQRANRKEGEKDG